MLVGLHDAEMEHIKGKTFPNFALLLLVDGLFMEFIKIELTIDIYFQFNGRVHKSGKAIGAKLL